jgi:hypothetical protein
VIYGQCNKLDHSKERCHFNNPNNKFEDKKEVVMNGISTQIGGGTRNKSCSKGGHKEVNKFGFIIYHCFIFNFIEHKIYNYLHKDTIHIMDREKAVVPTPKKGDIVVNMVLVVTKT